VSIARPSIAALITGASVTRIPSAVVPADPCTRRELPRVACRRIRQDVDRRLRQRKSRHALGDNRGRPKKKCAIHSGPCANGAKAVRVHALVRAADALLASQASELSASMAYMSLEGTGCTSLVRTVNTPIPTRTIAAAAQMNGVDQRAPSHSPRVKAQVATRLVR
jgi:hypothetical protein